MFFGNLLWRLDKDESCTPKCCLLSWQVTDLMDGCAVALFHLVKFINAADALVRQHERTALQHLLAMLHL